ncbi:hypothetical protein MASR2M48_18970 [Spirochaetota bacterium]
MVHFWDAQRYEDELRACFTRGENTDGFVRYRAVVNGLDSVRCRGCDNFPITRDLRKGITSGHLVRHDREIIGYLVSHFAAKASRSTTDRTVPRGREPNSSISS